MFRAITTARRSQQAFTLVEVLLALVIVGALVTLAVRMMGSGSKGDKD